MTISDDHNSARLYRDALAEGLRATTQWRRMKAEEYPEDDRNVSSAQALERAAEEVSTLDLTHPVLEAFVDLHEITGFDPDWLYSLGRAASRFGFDRLPGGVPIPYDLDRLLKSIMQEKLEGYDEGISGERPSPELIEFAAEWGVSISSDPYDSDEFTEALGVYVGPATKLEAIKALEAHSPGLWLARLADPDGQLLWHKQGWSWEVVEANSRTIFALALREQGSGNPAVYVDSPLVLSFVNTPSMSLTGECSRYSGGLEFKLGFGDYEGHTLTLVAWHDVWHETESGDLAPGLGAFVLDLTIED